MLVLHICAYSDSLFCSASLVRLFIRLITETAMLAASQEGWRIVNQGKDTNKGVEVDNKVQ